MPTNSDNNDSSSSLVVNISETPKASTNARPKNIKIEVLKTAEKPQQQRQIRVPKYFTSRFNATPEKPTRDLLTEPSPFAYPKDLEEFAHRVMTKVWRNDVRIAELNYKYNEKNNYRTRLQGDMLARLSVPATQDTSLQTIADINPDHFRIVEGRPIRSKTNVRAYVDTVRNVLRTKIVTGYREDATTLIAENLLLEQQMIDRIKRNFQVYVNTFEEFLYNDHVESMRLLKESETESRLAYNKYEEYKTLSKEFGALRSILYNTEEKWRNCKMYQTFLYLVSPMDWRVVHDPHYSTKDNTEALQEVFGKYRLNFDDEVNFSLEDLIDQFINDCKDQQEPLLYFKETDQLIDIFRFMELQNLNSLLHSEELALPLLNVKEGMVLAEQMYNDEITHLQDSIDKLESGLIWEETRAEYLKQLANELIEGKFRQLVVDEDILNLQVFVEDVYETRIGPNDANLRVNDMMKLIEARFLSELMKLDKIPAEIVSKMEVSFYTEEARIVKVAEQAARKLLELERLIETLNKAYALPYQRTGRELKWRSAPLNPPKPAPPPPRVLTTQDKEYLDFFTEYCQYTDDIKEYNLN